MILYYLKLSIVIPLLLFLNYLISKFIGRSVKLIIDYLHIDDWLKAKNLGNALYGIKIDEIVPFLTKLIVFIFLLQYLSWVKIKELQLLFMLVSLYGTIIFSLGLVLIVGLIFGEIIKQLILKTNIDIKERLGENIKLFIASLFVVSSINIISYLLVFTPFEIDTSIVNLVFFILTLFLFAPLLLRIAVKTYYGRL
ncbi:NEQ237 [Nanoarchaeum equitans Kin4-M]|uniref:NEQ237 n=1 Tax=Nanoarchaeum equitans (strain Kin4-M) TaxID=228908 RepID=Q74MS0_NANEQ|nr:NEQ237 [Nanoarchaeum equitans Kin4-M]